MARSEAKPRVSNHEFVKALCAPDAVRHGMSLR